MAEVVKEEVQSYSITGMNGLEFEVVMACLAVAQCPQVVKQLLGEGMDVPKKRVTEIMDQLWDEISEGK
jgi:hypothetical protein